MFVDDPRTKNKHLPPKKKWSHETDGRGEEIEGSHCHYAHMARDCTRWCARGARAPSRGARAS